MDFSIHLEFFLNRIENLSDKQLIENHHKILISHIECAKSLLIFKQQLIELYIEYTKNLDINNMELPIEIYNSIQNYINHLHKSIDEIKADGTIQKKIFKDNIFYLSKF
jgi:hypothetical protein